MSCLIEFNSGLSFVHAANADTVQVQNAVRAALDQSTPLTAAQEGEIRNGIEMHRNSLQESAHAKGLEVGRCTAAKLVLGEWR